MIGLQLETHFCENIVKIYTQIYVNHFTVFELRSTVSMLF